MDCTWQGWEQPWWMWWTRNMESCSAKTYLVIKLLVQKIVSLRFLSVEPSDRCDNAALSLIIAGWSTQQAGLTSCIYLNWSLQKGLQFTSYSSIVIHNSTVHYFFPLFTNVRPYLIRFKVRSWESHKVFTDIFLSHNVNCKLLLPFRHGSFWAAGALSKKIEMDWCWSRKKILDGIKITILKGQQTRHHALQYSGLILPNKLRGKHWLLLSRVLEIKKEPKVILLEEKVVFFKKSSIYRWPRSVEQSSDFDKVQNLNTTGGPWYFW